jgi:hypothetical protein
MFAPVALSLVFASCGGDSKKETGSPSVASAPSGTTSTTPESGASGTTGTHEKKSRRKARGTGGPATAPGNEVRKRVKRTRRRLEKRIEKIKQKAKKKSDRGGSTPTTTTPPPAPQPSASPQLVLYDKAKRVCDTLSLNGLAQKYDVEATPEAVSTAYAASYPVTFRKAVHDGCLAAFSG